MTKETRVSNSTPPEGGISLVKIVEVKSYNFESKKGDNFDVLDIVVDSVYDASADQLASTHPEAHLNVYPNGERQFTIRFFPKDEDDAKYEESVDIFFRSIAQLNNMCQNEPVEFEAKDWKTFFDKIALHFNGGKAKEAVAIFTDKPFWLLLSYYKNNLQLPAPNFAVRFNPKAVRKPAIVIGPKLQIVQATKPSVGGSQMGFTASPPSEFSAPDTTSSGNDFA